ncbi:transcription antitermination regulator [Knoellia sinensis KCTC 19936]|uniref:Transcription antitermination regulator n=1 Tax=Knoellia sinensis KCTC 19936 TaxID=1385520 RepID=A0A0A0J700_9MICO|nr:transcription antitermination regulator [Knoellia sinensis KCTC 19936]
MSLLVEDNHGGTIAASNATSRALEELQFALGEGPCIDAYTSRRPVLVADLQAHGSARWPGYAPAAHDHGVRAVFAFPLQVGAARAGALDVYRDEPGPLSAESLNDAFTFADVAMDVLVDSQNGDEGSKARADLDDVLAYRVEVYQAQGMVMVDLGVSIDEAMARIRGYAYAENQSIGDVARDIISGKIRLDKDTHEL